MDGRDTSPDLANRLLLAEFTSALNERVELGKRRENMKVLSIGVSGALFSFYFQGARGANVGGYATAALFLVPCLCLQFAALSAQLAWRTASLVRVISAARRKAAISIEGIEQSPQSAGSLFWANWAGAAPRPRDTVLDGVVLMGVFILPGVAAQTLIYLTQAHLTSYVFHVWFWINWILLGIGTIWRLTGTTIMLRASARHPR